MTALISQFARRAAMRCRAAGFPAPPQVEPGVIAPSVSPTGDGGAGFGARFSTDGAPLATIGNRPVDPVTELLIARSVRLITTDGDVLQSSPDITWRRCGTGWKITVPACETWVCDPRTVGWLEARGAEVGV